MSSVDKMRVKIGIVIIASPLENREDKVYTTEDFTPFDMLEKNIFMLALGLKLVCQIMYHPNALKMPPR